MLPSYHLSSFACMLLETLFSLSILLKACVEYARAEYDNAAAVILGSMLEGTKRTESEGKHACQYGSMSSFENSLYFLSDIVFIFPFLQINYCPKVVCPAKHYPSLVNFLFRNVKENQWELDDLAQSGTLLIDYMLSTFLFALYHWKCITVLYLVLGNSVVKTWPNRL